jgi:hypothetical protein
MDAVVVTFFIVGAELHHIPLGPFTGVLAGLNLVREILKVADAVTLVVEHGTGSALGVPGAHSAGDLARLAGVTAALRLHVGEEEPGIAISFLSRGRLVNRREDSWVDSVDVDIVEMRGGVGEERLAGELPAEKGYQPVGRIVGRRRRRHLRREGSLPRAAAVGPKP